MPLYRCNHCGHIEETPAPPQQTTCAACGKPVTAHDAATLLRHVMQRYTELSRQYKALQQQASAAAEGSAKPPAAKAAPAAKEERAAIDLRNAALHSTSALATDAQHKPLQDWFAGRGANAIIQTANVDMSGFFDEAAEAIGSNYQLMAPVMEHFRRTLNRGGEGMRLDLQKYEPQDAQHIQNLCRKLHGWTFFTNCNYKKQDKTLHIGFQSATAARQFLAGGWLEWFALGAALAEIKKKQGEQGSYSFSLARGLTLQFVNGDKNELDVVLLLHGKSQPIIIECKSGEFRSDIDKMARLARRLSLPKEHYIVLAADLDEEQTKALSAMYPLRFLPMQRLHEHIATLL